MKTRILITGASGFIGRNLFNYFSQKENMEVFGTYKSRPCVSSNHMYYGDLTREEVVRNLFKETKPQVLIHAAAATAGFQEFKKNEGAFIHDNVVMNMHLIALAPEYGVRHVVLLGCSLVYPSVDARIREADTSIFPLEHPYSGGAKVKIVMEDFAHTYARLSNGRTAYIIIRHSNIYGPYDKFHAGGHLVASKIAEVVNTNDGDIITIRGGGEERRDLLHIDDLIRFIDVVLRENNQRTDVWNVGCGHSYSVNEIVQRIVSVSGKQLTITNDLAIKSAPTQPALNFQKAKSVFHWTPRISLDEGICATMDWYRANKHLL